MIGAARLQPRRLLIPQRLTRQDMLDRRDQVDRLKGGVNPR